MRRNFVAEWLLRMVAEQREWMRERGETLAGYIDFYCARYGRPLDEAFAIYNADLEALKDFELRAGRRR